MNQAKNGELWNKLNKDEQDELLKAYNESFDAVNLIDHEEVMEQHKGWLSTGKGSCR